MGGLSPDALARLRALVSDGTFTKRFDLDREIGAGGMGRVYAGVEREGGKPIAIKVLDPQLSGDPVRFAAEAELLEQLDHPTIVSYVAHGHTSDGRAYLAMAWLDGHTLHERMSEGALPLADIVTIGHRVADALTYLHARGIVHRDIKPSNVFLVDKRPDRAIVIDLGIAKQLGGADGPTRTGQMVGTPGYMAPEQVIGDAAVDGRVDLFALGCLLHQAVAGEMPFPGEHVMEVLAHLLLHDPTPLDELVPACPARLATLVAVLLVKRAEDRDIDAARVRDELSAIARGLADNDAQALARSPLTRPVPTDRDASVSLRGNRDAPSATTLAASPAGRQREAIAASTVAPPRRARRSWIPFALVGAGGAIAAIAIATFVRRQPEMPASQPLVVAPELGSAGPPRHDMPPALEVVRPTGRHVNATLIEPGLGPAPGSLPSIWCKPRAALVTLASAGLRRYRVVTQTRQGAVATLATLATPKPKSPSSSPRIACLSSGRLLVVVDGHGFTIDEQRASVGKGVGGGERGRGRGGAIDEQRASVGKGVGGGERGRGRGGLIEGDTVTGPIEVPSQIAEVVAVKTTAYWATQDAVWDWNGGTARRVRTSCKSPAALSPDGTRSLCIAGDSLLVHDGTTEVAGPRTHHSPTSRPRWSADGKHVFYGFSGTIAKWTIGEPAGQPVASSGDFVVGERWLVSADSKRLGRVRLDGTGRPLQDIALTTRIGLRALIPEHDEIAVSIADRIEIVSIENPRFAFPEDRNATGIRRLAFTHDGKQIVTIAEDHRMIARSITDPKQRATWDPSAIFDAELHPLPDGMFTTTGLSSWALWNAAGKLSKIQPPLSSMGPATVVPGTSRIIRVGSKKIEELSLDGKLVEELYTKEVGNASWAKVDRTGRYVFVASSGAPSRLIDLEADRVVFEVVGEIFPLGAFAFVDAAEPTVAIASAKGHVFVATPRGTRMLFTGDRQLAPKIAVSPTRRQIAIGVLKDLVVVDIDLATEHVRGETESEIRALAWTPDGTAIIAGEASAAIERFDVP